MRPHPMHPSGPGARLARHYFEAARKTTGAVWKDWSDVGSALATIGAPSARITPEPRFQGCLEQDKQQKDMTEAFGPQCRRGQSSQGKTSQTLHRSLCTPTF